MPNKPSTYLLEKRAKKCFHWYPMATVIYYGPTNQVVTKVVVSILANDEEIIELKKWFFEKDLRWDEEINRQILEFIDSHEPATVVMPDKILGCPHEEGIDYPKKFVRNAHFGLIKTGGKD